MNGEAVNLGYGQLNLAGNYGGLPMMSEINGNADQRKKEECNQTQQITYDFGLTGSYQIKDLWQHKVIGTRKNWKGSVNSHETKLFRLTRK